MKFKGIIFISLLALLALLLPFQFCPQAYAQTSDVECWAVIVGVADYEHLGDLDYPDDDAQDLANKLEPIYGEDHIKLLIDEEATKENIGNAILYWLDPQESENDIVLIFFAGHGAYVGTDYYLCPYDSPNNISDDELAEWLEWLDGLESEKIVVILDSCHSGGFIDDLSGNGRVIMMACAADEDAWEELSLGHSVFTYYILDGFDHLDDVDTNNDNKISAEELFYYAEPKVEAYPTEEPQHPQLGDDYGGGSLSCLKYHPQGPAISG